MFRLAKDYGDIGISGVCSSCLSGGLAVFGGYGLHCLRVVKVAEKELVVGTLRTAFQFVFSVESCRVSESRVLVSVGGGTSSYSGSCSDVFEVRVGGRDNEGGDSEGNQAADKYDTNTESQSKTKSTQINPKVHS